VKVLVSGATGFVGAAVVRRLRAAGHAVRAAVRTARPLPDGVEPAVVGAIDGDTDWRAALDGVDAVVHLAARVHVMRDEAPDPLAAFRRVNRDGTRRLARSCGGVTRVILVSSIKAQVDEVSAAPIDERTPALPTSPYGISKLEAEVELAAAGAALGFRWLALRPPLVLGPGVGGNLRRLLDAVHRGWPLPLGAVHNRRSLLYVDNLADAIAHGLEAGAAHGLAVPLTDGPPHATADLVRGFAAAMGRPARLVRVPPALLAAGARLVGRPEVWSRLAGDLEIAESTRRLLDWEPPVAAAEAIRRTAAGYRPR
jgi:nucleoside-diphosphate-sugar epimerase